MRATILLLIALLMGTNTHADGEKAGEFDYYVLALSWSPNWCTIEGDQKGSPQCAEDQGHGWVMHGLWPQYHRGWPSYCRTNHRNPPRSLTNQMSDIMGTSGLAWYQWKKHGRCSGLSADDYFATARRAYESIMRPDVLRRLTTTITVPASVIEQAFLKENPKLEPDMLTITCRNDYIQEARVCLSKYLAPVPCGRDVIHDCNLRDAILEPIR
ncbi:ribonuclease T2 family protein [Shimia abyssi]|uniref:Ribonuclease T2 n=1 Tax=Shimia abyssi TaxID=1662395 RepID=A0A2P8FKP2_9RHOB|nr:ribonuclease T2 [Shimia abyssi]PSL22269.1 ribonuclease T2 [Shimia abyssi]